MTFFYDLNKRLAAITDKSEPKQLNEGALPAVAPHREKGPKKSEVPAIMRKSRGQSPLTLQDLEREQQRALTNPTTLKRLGKEVSTEELVGGQKKLDKNHNGELDAQDFAILRRSKGKEETDESALQAYLGKKKYGKEGMAALQKAGREGASKETMAKIRAKHDQMDEGWDDMMKDVEDRAKKPKVGDKERGHKHDIEHTPTGRKVTRRVDDQGHSVGAEDDEDHKDQPKRRGRPKGSKHSTGAKINTGKSKLMTKEADHNGDEVKHAMAVLKKAGYKISKAQEELDEKAVSVAQRRAAGIAHAAQKGEIPKSELRGASKEMAKMSKGELHKFAATKEKGLPKKKTEESDQGGAEETKSKSKGGFSFGKGIYDSYNREVEEMIAESMNISMNMSNDSHGGPGKSLTVTATDDDAMKLASLLKMAGLGGSAGAEASAEPCSDCGMEDCGCDHELDEVDENQPDYPTNTEEGDALQYSGGLNGPKSTGQTTTPVIASQLDRQVTHEDDAMGRTGDDITLGEEDELARIREMAGIREAAKPDYIDLDKEKAKDEKVEEMMSTENSRTRLIDAVLEQIKADVAQGDMTAIEELIQELPADVLMNFLPET